MIEFDPKAISVLSDDIQIKILEMWTSSSALNMAGLSKSLRLNLWTEVAEVSHSIKGASIQIGAKTVSLIAAQLEKEAKFKKSVSEAELLVEKLHEGVMETTKKIDHLIAEKRKK